VTNRVMGGRGVIQIDVRDWVRGEMTRADINVNFVDDFWDYGYFVFNIVNFLCIWVGDSALMSI